VQSIPIANELPNELPNLYKDVGHPKRPTQWEDGG